MTHAVCARFARIVGKYALRRFYEAVYERYRARLEECPRDGLAIELGSGAGFARERIPELIATDVIEYAGLDRVVDATAMINPATRL
jgi:hypothetical protein